MSDPTFIMACTARITRARTRRLFALYASLETDPEGAELELLKQLNGYLVGTVTFDKIVAKRASLSSKAAASEIGVRIGDPYAHTLQSVMSATGREAIGAAMDACFAALDYGKALDSRRGFNYNYRRIRRNLENISITLADWDAVN